MINTTMHMFHVGNVNQCYFKQSVLDTNIDKAIVFLKHIYYVVSSFHVKHQTYITGKSCNLALDHLERGIEKDNTEIALTAFLDIEGVFDNIRTAVMSALLGSHSNHKLPCEWISEMLRGRIMSASLFSASLTVSTTRRRCRIMCLEAIQMNG